jgi:hypothetical protein
MLVVVTMGAICRTLAHIYNFGKKRSSRDWAEARLRSLTPEVIVLMGLLADAGDEAESFVRYTDRSGYDLTELVCEVHLFMTSVYRLFVKRKIVNAQDSYVRIALEFVRERRTFMLRDAGECGSQLLFMLTRVNHHNTPCSAFFSAGFAAGVVGVRLTRNPSLSLSSYLASLPPARRRPHDIRSRHECSSGIGVQGVRAATFADGNAEKH